MSCALQAHRPGRTACMPYRYASSLATSQALSASHVLHVIAIGGLRPLPGNSFPNSTHKKAPARSRGECNNHTTWT
ncbi:hypothetical protein AB4851_15195 [Burkholderia sp. 22PA0099]|uniref:hypothetical protein n=1 Tax=Burkholderia sp. 22PA0099 TaxID=3237372 RepID=UPI0039C3A015